MLKRILSVLLIFSLLFLSIGCQNNQQNLEDVNEEVISELNILSNSTFDQPIEDIQPGSNGALDSNKNWVYYQNTGGQGYAEVNEGQLKVVVENSGQNDYSIQMLQSPVSIEDGVTYEIRFDAKSESDLRIAYKIGAIADRQWTAYDQKTFSLDDEMKEYTFEFKMDGLTDDKARFELWFVEEGEYTLDNIQLIKGEAEKAEDLPKPDLSFYNDKNLSVEEKVEKIINLMSLEEKIGQMVMAERTGISPESVKRYSVGALLSGGGSVPGKNEPEDWINMYNTFQKQALGTRLEIPIIYGVDSVHGHNNLKNATIFPHNIGLGAMGKGLLEENKENEAKDLMKKIGNITALETSATGVNWNFAPAVSVVRDIRWGRSYESYGESPELQNLLVKPYINGLQGEGTKISENKVVATAKHFIGDGGTEWNTGTSGYIIDRGDVDIPLEELKRIHMQGYIEAIDANVGSVMASYNSYKDLKMHGNDLIKALLKDELGFKGVVVSDWEGVDEIYAPIKYDKIVLSVNAGVDLFMEPYNWKDFIKNLTQAVDNGDVEISRINDAVERILTMKFMAGLFEMPYATNENISKIGTKDNREVASEAVRKSLVLLKNKKSTLPLDKNEKVFLLGDKADNLGIQCGGWTINWQGFDGNKETTGTTIKEGILNELSSENKLVNNISNAEKVVVVVGEKPYAEGKGDSKDLALSDEDQLNLDKAIKSNKEVVVVMLAGRPLIITDYIDDIDSLVMAWLPGTEGNGVTDVLFGKYDFVGKLPVSWPREVNQEPINIGDDKYNPLYKYGFGLKMGL